MIFFYSVSKIQVYKYILTNMKVQISQIDTHDSQVTFTSNLSFISTSALSGILPKSQPYFRSWSRRESIIDA